MEQEMEALRKQLIQEALSLRKRLVQYYLSGGDPEPEKGLPEFLKDVAEKLAQNPVDALWIREHIWGIYRVVSDNYLLERSALGKDLYSFKDRAREFAERVIAIESKTEAK